MKGVPSLEMRARSGEHILSFADRLVAASAANQVHVIGRHGKHELAVHPGMSREDVVHQWMAVETGFESPDARRERIKTEIQMLLEKALQTVPGYSALDRRGR